MKKEELNKISNANRDLWLLSIELELETRQAIGGTEIDKIIVNLLKDVTFLLDEIEKLEKCKPF